MMDNQPNGPGGPFRIAIDTGGTFTDAALADRHGNLVIGKALTTYSKIFDGVKQAVADAANKLGVSTTRVLAECEILIYGTTHATNAILTGSIARTALLTTEGFTDLLVLREGGKANPFDFSREYPDPYVPRHLTFGVPERIDAEGQVVRALDLDATTRIVARLSDLKVDAIAVCLLWSIVNPIHETTVGNIIEKYLPRIPYTLSHRLNPIIREYRRASASAIDASLKPLVSVHLLDLETDLRGAGFAGELVAVTSLGGSMHVDQVIKRPIYLVKSGPSMAPVAARAYAFAEEQAGDLIVCDTGGTSFDVSLVRDGRISETRETWLGDRFTGHMTGLSSVDVKSIGSGGGSIAWIDPGGLLRVGPQSAGAEPGPACYGRGGRNPTVTDAALLLGYLDPNYFLGGRMRLDAAAAQLALQPLADALGLDLQRAAQAVMVIANEHMVKAISELTINEGVDPRQAIIIAGGGAAGLNIVPIARELGCRNILVPRTAGALSACGGQYSDIVSEFSISQYAHTDGFDISRVNAALERIDASLDDVQTRLVERGLSNFHRAYHVEARYPFQSWELRVPVEPNRFSTSDDVLRLREKFHEEHERIFAVREEGQHVETLYWSGRLTASLPRPKLTNADTGHHQLPAPRANKPAFFEGEGEVQTPRYLGDMLRVGAEIDGPAMIDEATTTVVVYPGSKILVTPQRNYLLTVTETEVKREFAVLGGNRAKEKRTYDFDPVLLAVIANRLNAICREMMNTVLRSGRSTVLSMARDFSCSIVTKDNELLTGAEGLPVHIFGSHLLTKAMHELHQDVAEGDAFLHNDPYLGNTHAADHTILVPVFVDGSQMFTACVKAHQADAGNSLPTTYMPNAVDVYSEGALIFPCVRIQRNFENVEDIIRMCRKRLRVPEQWYGDYLACLGAARIGERRLKELVAKYGQDVVHAFTKAWFSYSETRIAQAIAKLPAGEVVGTGAHDPLPNVPAGVPIKVVVRTDPDAQFIEVDLRDNVDCVPAGVNQSEACAINNVLTGVLNSLEPDLPVNAGTFRRIKVYLRYNCVVGIPKFPASTSMATTNIGDRLVNITQAAFAQLAPGLGLAEGGLSMGPGIAVVSGQDWRRNRAPYVNELVLESNGGPASAVTDGWLNYGTPVIAGMMYRDSIEVDEQKYPILVHSLEIVRDSGGAGKRRGAPGQKVVYGPRHDPMTVIYPLDGHFNPPRGVRGGGQGIPARALKIDLSGVQEALPNVAVEHLMPGESIVGVTNGGGGYGDPFDREPERVLKDVLERWVSRDQAEVAYGVVLAGEESDENLSINWNATKLVRAERARRTDAIDD